MIELMNPCSNEVEVGLFCGGKDISIKREINPRVDGEKILFHCNTCGCNTKAAVNYNAEDTPKEFEAKCAAKYNEKHPKAT